MPCWVAPTLAAELWHIPLPELMRRIESGEIPVRREDGFMFVDVAPYGARVERPIPPHERPDTFVTIDAIDGESLDEEVAPPASDEPAVLVTDEEASVLLMPSSDELELGPADDTASVNLGDWRAARRKAARSRIPPKPPRRLSA
jgi:hypothetical protein